MANKQTNQKPLRTEKKSNTHTFSDLILFQFKLLENIIESGMEPIQIRTQNEPQDQKYIVCLC